MRDGVPLDLYPNRTYDWGFILDDLHSQSTQLSLRRGERPDSIDLPCSRPDLFWTSRLGSAREGDSREGDKH